MYQCTVKEPFLYGKNKVPTVGFSSIQRDKAIAKGESIKVLIESTGEVLTLTPEQLVKPFSVSKELTSQFNGDKYNMLSYKIEQEQEEVHESNPNEEVKAKEEDQVLVPVCKHCGSESIAFKLI